MRRTGFKLKYKPNKYKAVKTLKDGILFDSKLESTHYEQLKLMQAAKEISELELQKEFILNINGKQVGIYIADFHYFDETEKKYVISDAKGIETDVFKIKWKIMKALYSGYIFEIRKQTKVIRS